MNHISYEEWIRYAAGEIDKDVQETYENHLYGCESCLELFMMAVEEINLPTSQPIEEGIFTDQVMQEIEKQQKQPDRAKAGWFLQHTIAHYMIATAFTLILMSSGIFSHITGIVSNFEAGNKEESSIILQFMDTSASIIHKVEEQLKEGNENE